jgi:LacI family transcriptional regulator
VTPPLVGILGDTLGDPYSLRIIEGAFQRFSRLGYHAVGLAGGFPNAPMFQGENGVLFPPALDALVLLSETLDNSDRVLQEAVNQSRTTVVSIGVELARTAVVRVNDEVGILQAFAHLVKRHDCRSIAFIAGPERSRDSQRRLDAYKAALKDFGLTFDPTLVARGDYEARSGYEAVHTLRQRKNRGFDAIIAANDLMAIGAIDGLKAQGISIPDTVKVIGFDDTAEAAFVAPALTTVKQPILEQGMAAVDLVAKLLAHESPNDATLTTTALVIRNSCGCNGPDSRRSFFKSATPANERELIDDAFRKLIRRQLASQRVHAELSRLAEPVIAATGYQELAQAMTQVFRLLRPRRFLLCTYAGNQRHARVVLESTGREVVFRNESEQFPVGRLFPTNYLKNGGPAQLLVEPLHIGAEHFGYSVIETADLDPHAHIELRYILSSVLNRIAVARELRRLYLVEKNFSDLRRQSEERASSASVFPARRED